MISAHQLSKTFDQRTLVLHNISLSADTGRIICIIGPSGCGKTTLLRMLLGIDQAYSGQINIDNSPQSEYLKKARPAFVSQQYANFPWLTVKQNISLATNQSPLVDQMIKDLGLWQARDFFPDQLSGGMRQRISIGRAFLQNTSIIGLDEPFGALDTELRIQMQEFLERLLRKQKKTILMVTHDVEEALFLADVIWIMGDKPGTIKHAITVPFSRPRPSALRFSQTFERYKRMISFMTRAETMKLALIQNTQVASESIRLGLYIWAGSMPFYLAQHHGLYEKNGLSVDLIPFEDNKEKLTLWKEGKIQLAHVTLDTALSIAKKYPLDILCPLSRSEGADAIIGNNLQSITQLKGRKIGVEMNGVSYFFLRYILRKYHIDLNKLTLVDLNANQMAQKLILGEIDAAVLWEPWLSKTMELTHANILASSKDHPVLLDVLIAKKGVAQKYKREIEVLKNAWNEAVHRYTDAREHSLEMVASSLGQSTSNLEQQLKHITFLNTGDSISLSLEKEVRKAL